MLICLLLTILCVHRMATPISACEAESEADYGGIIVEKFEEELLNYHDGVATNVGPPHLSRSGVFKV